MTLTNTDRSVTYTGNGSTTSWDYTFKIPDSGSYSVYLVEIATGAETALTVTTDYTITGIGDDAGGSVTYPLSGSPLASTHKIVIARNVPRTQTTTITNQTAYYASVVMAVWDRLTMMIQELDDDSGRTLQTALDDGVIATLPRVADRASKFLYFDASGDPTAASGVSGSPVSSAMEPVIAAATLALARTAMDVQQLNAALTDIAGITFAQGDIIHHDGSDLVKLAIGTAKQMLAVNAGATALEYIDALGQQTIWMPAGAMTPTTTNGAASSSTELTTNDVMKVSLDFDDSTNEYACFEIQMPKGWDEGTLVAQFLWMTDATSGDCIWGIQAVAVADDDAQDTAYGTAVEVTDTAKGTAKDLAISGETAAMTVAGSPGAEELVQFKVYRDGADASDTMTGDALLLGVKIHYTTEALTDD